MLWHLERDNLALDGIINVIDGIILIKKFTFVKLCCLPLQVNFLIHTSLSLLGVTLKLRAVNFYHVG